MVGEELFTVVDVRTVQARQAELETRRSSSNSPGRK